MQNDRHIHLQTGFTLVEISIVLLIIGLLLGSILKGQTLLNSARVRNLANQQAGIQAAYYGFIDRYRALPGDMIDIDATAALGTTVTGGNSNGRIDATSWAEAGAVWQHLAAAEFITGNYAGATDQSSYVQNSPNNAFGASILLAETTNYPSSNTTSPSALSYIFGRNVPVDVIRELDIKLDDGQPNTGILRAASATKGYFDTIDGTATNCVNTTTTSTWDIAGDATDCGAIFLY